jgi:hypothetical protein
MGSSSRLKSSTNNSTLARDRFVGSGFSLASVLLRSKQISLSSTPAKSSSGRVTQERQGAHVRSMVNPFPGLTISNAYMQGAKQFSSSKTFNVPNRSLLIKKRRYSA